MRVSDLARHPLATLDADDTLLQAAREMEDNSLSAILVFDEGGALVGIFTHRDVVRAAAEGAQFDRTPLEEYMTGDPVVLRDDESVDRALRTMLDGGFRHIPLVDDENDPVAILSISDLIAAGQLQRA